MFLSLARHSGFLPLCPWQISCGFSSWAPAPFAVCFAVFRMVRRKSGWGICVLPWFCLFVFWLFCLLWFAKIHVTTGVHVAVFLLTASSHVRTEPQSVIGHTRGKKKPLVGPPCPSRLLPKFSAQKEDESWSFQSCPLLINSINLKRDGVGICLGKDVGRGSIEGFLPLPSFRYRFNYIG